MKAEHRADTAPPSSNIAAAAASVLGVEGANDFRRRLEVVHAPDRRDPEARCAPDEFPLGDGIAILLPEDADDVTRRAARDFEDYLAVSMNVMAHVCRHGGAPAAGAVVASLDPSLRERECRIEVAADGVRLAGRDPRALAQAFYHLEDLMNLRGGPFLRHGVTTRRPRFAVRMTHSGYGDDLFPDEHLAQMAHHGMTAIIVFLKGVDQTTGQGHQDVNALIRRAARHGLDTYLYSCVEAFAHPDDGDGAFDESYGTIAGRYPEAKGIILVGESCQFPSKDPRVQPVAYRDKDANDPRPLAGWFPCADYPAWLEAVQRAIRKRAPGMEVVFWTYNWGWAPAADRLRLIDSLPHDVTLMATFEMFERRTLRNGIETPTADYTISFPGPGEYFVSEAGRAKGRGLRLYTQANAGGLTWDFGTVPYQPVPQQWRRRWDALVAANAAWGLSGIMENHHFGWWPSFVAELEKEALTEGGIPFDEHLAKIAARDFGAENAARVVEVWRTWSRDAGDYSPSDLNQYGTFRIGPAYPFAFGAPAVGRDEFPGCRSAPTWPADICRLDYLREGFVPQLTPERMDDEFLLKEVELLEPMAADFAAGADVFLGIAATATGRRRANAARAANFAGYLAAATRTAVNVKRGAVAFRRGDRAALLAAARAEYANAGEALAFVRRDSRLGWEPSMEYCGGPDQIRWKLALMEKTYGKENLQ